MDSNDMINLQSEVDQIVGSNEIVLFYVDKITVNSTERFLKEHYRSYAALDISDNLKVRRELQMKTGLTDYPIIFYKNLLLAPSVKLESIISLDKTDKEMNRELNNSEKYDFDVVVIGGGSGGNSFSKRAAELKARVCVVDYVEESTQGFSWGYGGTCVNVGCVPKKLLHQATLIGKHIKRSSYYGYKTEYNGKPRADWNFLISAVQNHVKSLNFGYRVQLRKYNIQYENAKAKLLGKHEIELTNMKTKQSKTVTTKYIVLACGCRPNYPDNLPGARELAISSDDFFWRSSEPGDTLVIGAGYVALECASIMASLGFKVTIAVRSIALRHFDQDMTERLCKHLEKNENITFLWNTKVVQLIKYDNDKIVSIVKNNFGVKNMMFKTVMVATGRRPRLEDIGLKDLGILVDPLSGKVVTRNCRTTVENIFAIGDCALEYMALSTSNSSFNNGINGIELTPVAIKCGYVLADMLFSENVNNTLIDCTFVPTTIFTDLEYGCIGFTEETANRMFPGRIEVYHNSLYPFEWILHKGPTDACYVKLIVETNKQRVIGFHYLGPDAGEVTQGFVIALKMGATKLQFNAIIGIHPTNAEVFSKLMITKSSGKDITYSGC
ncbi:hypothetical protein GJ496_011538 [Pomphorhynchus laevis]|nr:hypothetical protein GJ496_011538 [Pomphorhynchus laevis]